MKILENIVTNPLLIAIIMLKDLVEIFKQIKMGDLSLTHAGHTGFDWFDFSVKLFIAIALWLVIKAYFKLKNEMEIKIKVFNTISEVRAKLQFLKLYENHKFYKLPNETDEEFANRTPDGLYNTHYTNEYNIVKLELQKALTNKTVAEIDKLLSEFYNY